MAKPRSQSKAVTKKQSSHKKAKQPQKAEQQQHSWGVVRGFLQTCKHSNSHTQPVQQQESQKKKKQKQVVVTAAEEATSKKSKKMKCSGSLCSNTKVMQRPDQNQNQITQTTPPEARKKRASSSSTSTTTSTSTSTSTSSSSTSGPFRFRRLSGCYECRMVVDPLVGFTKDPSLRETISTCPHCGKIFTNPDSLNLHQAVRHAVSELGAEDTSKNIVEIIFQSSWGKKRNAHIDRILKVHNTQPTLGSFESYRDAVKAKAKGRGSDAATRCVADGNELLRFHAATLACSLGLNGSTSLCGGPCCEGCSIIKNGFRPIGPGILTTATSARAHSASAPGSHHLRAMLLCRVIAGRVNVSSPTLGSDIDDYDSLAGPFSTLDDLYVLNPKAILPCFVVVYSGF